MSAAPAAEAVEEPPVAPEASEPPPEHAADEGGAVDAETADADALVEAVLGGDLPEMETDDPPPPFYNTESQTVATLVTTGIKPRTQSPAKRYGGHSDAFGSRTKRFSPVDYTLGGWGAENPLVRDTTHLTEYHTIAPSPDIAKMFGYTNVSPLAPPVQQPRPWIGSRSPAKMSEGEIRLQELQNLRDRKAAIDPGPGSYNLYTDAMPVSRSTFRKGIPVPSNTTVPKDFDISGLSTQIKTPGPGSYKCQVHKENATPKTESIYGKATHLSVGRTGHSPIPKIRAPSISYAMRGGHDWRAVLELQRPKFASSVLGALKDNTTTKQGAWTVKSAHGSLSVSTSKPPAGAGRKGKEAQSWRPASQNTQRTPKLSAEEMATALKQRPVSVQSMRDVDKVHIPAVDWFQKFSGQGTPVRSRSRPESREAFVRSAAKETPAERSQSGEPPSTGEAGGAGTEQRSRPTSRLSQATPDPSYVESTFAAQAAIDVKQRQLEWRKRNLLGPHD